MPSRPDVVNAVLSLFDEPAYLEVGVNRGETFHAIKAARKVAVDPKFVFDSTDPDVVSENETYHEVTSDEYFCRLIPPGEKFQVIYLDGLHTFEQTLRDFNNSISFLADDGVIVIDDVIPTSYQASLPSQLDAFRIKDFTKSPEDSWMGDTYKLVYFIDTFFPMFSFRTVSDNHGQSVVWRGTRPADSFKQRLVEDVARTTFLDVVKSLDVFRLATLDEIVKDIMASRAEATE